MSVDGTMVAVPHSDSPQTSADNSPAAGAAAGAGASDTESNSERDLEVYARLHVTLDSVFYPFCVQLQRNSRAFILSSDLPHRVRGGEESAVKCVVLSGILERQYRLG